ncbi:MAG TPA: Ig-like domain repeat protein [Pyrinomonadaceae bacterium]|nr:Ig-like domain repeat protein [Pyrinomonadaceae bacterium]
METSRATAGTYGDGDEAGPLQDGEFRSSGRQTARPDGEDEKARPRPREERLTRARSFNGDLRNLPRERPVKQELPEREGPQPNPTLNTDADITQGLQPDANAPVAPPAPSAPAPTPSANFAGLDFANWGAGHPPDTVGDVGPTYYIQSINSSIGIFNKTTGVRVAAFTLNTFMSQGAFGNLCDTNNFGDPVVLYDTFEDRWVITDFAFQLSGGAVVNPPGAFQCVAVSKTSDPVSGGWNFYSTNTTGGLGDYPKLGVWPDGLYMSVNMFGYAAGAPFQGVRVYAFNKAQMYAGAPTVQIVSFDIFGGDFTVIPSNARLQTGTPPPGTPNYFVSTWLFSDALSVYKFHVDWDRISLSTLSNMFKPSTGSVVPNAAVPNAPSQGGNFLDVLQWRAMMQNQYTNLGGVESLWATHTIRRGNTSGFAAPRFYQLNVTGGNVAASTTQAATFDPDGANVIYRFMPSLAVDRAGDMALGYSTSSSTTKPAIKYAGRLATDPVNTFSQTEQVLIQGTGTQTGSCNGTCTRWGDYSAMSLDPDGCTFWYTNMYYIADGLNHQTRIGAFAYPQCTPVGAGGTLSGTVTDGVTSGPVGGATVTLGNRTTTTDSSGNYSFAGLPAGTYPTVNVSAVGYNSASATSVVVSDAATTTKDFALAAAPRSACLADTVQPDFQLGLTSNTDLTTNPGDIILVKPSLDQQNTTLGSFGVGITTTTWGGQTFTPAVSGTLTKVDINLFCSGCSGTAPDLTLSLRATSSNLPTGADLASATIAGFNLGSSAYYTATFASPPALVAGTKYALLIRPNSTRTGTYALTRSGTQTVGADVYAGGTRLSGATSGTVWSIPLTGGVSTDTGFRTYMDSGYSASGEFTSGLKDANPPATAAPHWTTLSWNATTPAGTSVKFQAAASNSVYGPFNFVGPDGTAATYYTTSGDSLSQFDGFRYLKYKAYLATTDSTVTPAVNDVTACLVSPAPNITAAAAISRQQGSLTVHPQIATVGDSFFAANTLTVTATPLTGSGVTVNGVGVDASGNVTADITADCSATNSTFTLTVKDTDNATATATFNVNVTANTGPTLAYNSDSVNINGGKTINPSVAPSDTGTIKPIAVQSTGTYTGGVSVNATTGAVTLTNAAPAGTHTILIRATDNCGADTDATLSLTVNKLDQTITFNAISDKLVNEADFDPGATASSNLPVSYTATGDCSLVSGKVHLTGAGSCTVTAKQAGNGTYNAASDVQHSFSINKLTQTITFDPLSDKTYGDADLTLNATASSNLSVSLATAGDCALASGKLHITGAGSCTVTASQAGNATYSAASDVVRTFQIAKAATSTAVVSSVSPAAVGQSVTFTATVTSPAGTPNGSVQFKVDGVNLGSAVALNASGVATFTTNTLAAGGHVVNAEYGGSSNFLNSAGTLAGGQSVGEVFDFSQASYTVAERGGAVTITVTRTGATPQALTVDYTTDDGGVPSVFVPCAAATGQASERCDYERASGTLRFAANETQKTFTVLVNDDSFAEGTETLTLRLSNPGGPGILGTQSVATLQITDDVPESVGNPSDDSAAFVRQHYRDFLNREPDAPGLAFWTGEITSCGADAVCREVKRINVSAAFFLSIEFQQTGYLVYRMDKAAFGDINPPTVPVPARLNEFLRDTQEIGRGVIMGQGNWQQQLEANKAAFALAFVQRPEFLARYPALTSAAAFVNSLDQNAGGVLDSSEKAALVAELAQSPADANLRASVLRKVAEDADLVQREKNRAFVLMQYFGYLRRNPDDAPDTNFDGFNFWLTKLNQFNGDAVAAEMVKAFINSDEYRHRFGQ